MAARICSTGGLLLIAALGFLGAGPSFRGALDPLGLLCLMLSGVCWFGWAAIEAAYAYREEVTTGANPGRTYLMMVRLGPWLAAAMRHRDR